jgi:hypothetical protein
MDWIKKARLGRFELYNLREDLEQAHERSAQDPGRLDRMRTEMIKFWRGIQAEGPRWEAWRSY